MTTPDAVPALALAVLREHHADEVRKFKAILRRSEGQADEIANLTEQVKHHKARTANAEHALMAANSRANAAHQEAEAVRQRIADDIRAQARTVSRTWAGAYRNIANQIAGGAA